MSVDFEAPAKRVTARLSTSCSKRSSGAEAFGSRPRVARRSAIPASIGCALGSRPRLALRRGGRDADAPLLLHNDPAVGRVWGAPMRLHDHHLSQGAR